MSFVDETPTRERFDQGLGGLGNGSLGPSWGLKSMGDRSPKVLSFLGDDEGSSSFRLRRKDIAFTENDVLL